MFDLEHAKRQRSNPICPAIMKVGATIRPEGGNRGSCDSIVFVSPPQGPLAWLAVPVPEFSFDGVMQEYVIAG